MNTVDMLDALKSANGLDLHVMWNTTNGGTALSTDLITVVAVNRATLAAHITSAGATRQAQSAYINVSGLTAANAPTYQVYAFAKRGGGLEASPTVNVAAHI